MKYTTDFIDQLQQLDSMVILQKEYSLYEHKKRHVRKMIALNYSDRSTVRHYEKEYRELTRGMLMLEKQMSPNQEFVNCPRSMISRYMELYQVSIYSVARTLHISSNAITSFLKNGRQTSETKTFIYWAIRNFRLDANLYWDLIENLSEPEVI